MIFWCKNVTNRHDPFGAERKFFGAETDLCRCQVRHYTSTLIAWCSLWIIILCSGGWVLDFSPYYPGNYVMFVFSFLPPGGQYYFYGKLDIVIIITFTQAASVLGSPDQGHVILGCLPPPRHNFYFSWNLPGTYVRAATLALFLNKCHRNLPLVLVYVLRLLLPWGPGL